jgi:hypothetical protein
MAGRAPTTVSEIAPENVFVAEDEGDRIVDLMGDAGRHLPEGRHLLLVDQHGLRLLQRIKRFRELPPFPRVLPRKDRQPVVQADQLLLEREVPGNGRLPDERVSVRKLAEPAPDRLRRPVRTDQVQQELLPRAAFALEPRGERRRVRFGAVPGNRGAGRGPLADPEELLHRPVQVKDAAAGIEDRDAHRFGRFEKRRQKRPAGRGAVERAFLPGAAVHRFRSPVQCAGAPPEASSLSLSATKAG